MVTNNTFGTLQTTRIWFQRIKFFLLEQDSVCAICTMQWQWDAMQAHSNTATQLNTYMYLPNLF